MIATIMTFISGQQSNCHFGKSTLRQKVWKFTVDKLTNGLSTGHPWCADIIKPDNITPISSASIICGNNTILSGILTQHSDIYSPHSPHCKHHETHFGQTLKASLHWSIKQVAVSESDIDMVWINIFWPCFLLKEDHYGYFVWNYFKNMIRLALFSGLKKVSSFLVWRRLGDFLKDQGRRQR